MKFNPFDIIVKTFSMVETCDCEIFNFSTSSRGKQSTSKENPEWLSIQYSNPVFSAQFVDEFTSKSLSNKKEIFLKRKIRKSENPLRIVTHKQNGIEHKHH